MANSLIKNLFYASPYSVPPPGVGTTGVTLQTDPAQSPTPAGVTNPVLVIRLRMASSPVVIGISATSGPGTSVKTAIYQPSFPLSATESYMIDIIWVPSGTPPENIDWNSAIASAPVTAAEVMVDSAAFNGTTLDATVTYGASSVAVGAQVNVFALSGGVYVNIGSAQTQGNRLSVPVTTTGFTAPFSFNAQAIIPTSNSGGGAFAPPFSMGPPTVISNYTSVPQAAKTIAAAVYNGKSLSLSWNLDTVAGCVNPDSSLIQVLASNQVVASFKGGPVSANIPLDIYGQSNITVQLSTVANNIGSTPLSFSLITQAPTVTNVVADKTAGKVTANITTTPTGLSAQAYLMDGDIVLAGPVAPTSGVVSFSYSTSKYNVEGMVGLSVVASSVSADGTVTGPASKPAILLATAPILQSALLRIDPANNAQWRADIAWNRLPDSAANVTAYTVSVLQETTVIATQTISGTTATLTFAKTAIDTTKTQTIQLFATGITGGNSPAQTLYALFAPPLLASLVTTKGQIGITWTVPATLPAANTLPVSYRAIIASGAATIYRGNETTATRSAIQLAALSIPDTGNLVAMVNISLGPVTLQCDPSMAATCSASPLLTAPIINATTAAATTNIATLNWTAVTGANAIAYNINFTKGNPQTNIPTNAFALTTALTPGALLGYTVRATGTSNGVPVTGPPSNEAWVPTNMANVSTVRFTGSNTTVEWEQVPDAVCYCISVYDNATPANQVYTNTTSATSDSFTITAASGKEYTAYVQPIMKNGTGLAGTSLKLFAPALFLSQQPASAAYPYIYPAQSMSVLGSATTGPTAQAIVLYLPELGAASGALGTTPIEVAPFKIEPSGNTALPYKLTIAADPLAWTFNTTAIRAALQQAYVNFLKNIETPPGGTLAGATPFGISLVQLAIACSLPQTFAEQLYYNFGFSTVSTVGSGYVDLRPGMVLRVAASDYIGIAQSGLPSWINGYAGATILDFEIGSYLSGTNWRTGFDAFLNTLTSQGSLTVSSPAASTGSVQAGLAGAVDLYYPQFIQPFYRLYFPSAISSPWGNGSNLTGSNFTLVAAGKYSSLQSTTVDPSNNPTAYFRGRAIVEVMIKVLVNGSERLVPIGTSLGNLLEQLGLRPASTSPILKQLRVYRSIVPAITSTTTATALGPQLELCVDWNGLAVYGTGNGLNAMSVPLMPGDQVITNKY